MNLAIEQAGPSNLTGLIHHTDHGVQYTAWPYFDRLQSVSIQPSMGEVGNCYENALAERMNGILKYEYGLDSPFVERQQALVSIQQAIWLYNHERPRLPLNYRKPAQVHLAAHSDVK